MFGIDTVDICDQFLYILFSWKVTAAGFSFLIVWKRKKVLHAVDSCFLDIHHAQEIVVCLPSGALPVFFLFSVISSYYCIDFPEVHLVEEGVAGY